MLDHISKPYDEYEVVQDEEELREEDEEILRQSSNLKLSLDILEAFIESWKILCLAITTRVRTRTTRVRSRQQSRFATSRYNQEYGE